MDKIFKGNDEYLAVGIVSYSEEHFVQQVLSLAPLAYPGWKLVPFDPIVDCEGVIRKPDLALVADDLSTWYVVEAELSSHPLLEHVVPQVRDLSRGNYATTDCFNRLSAALPSFARSQLEFMLRNIEPKMLVIAFGSAPDWRPTLRGIPADLHEMRIFRSSKDEHLVLMDGPALARPDDQTVLLERVPSLTSLLKIAPAPVVDIGLSPVLEWEEEMVPCTVITLGGERYLQADGFRHIDGTNFELVINANRPHAQLKRATQ